MNRKDVIEVLKMENDLITFDPATGEDIDVKCLNALNKKCYIAHEEAIDFLSNSISIEYMKQWAKDRIRENWFGDHPSVIARLIVDWEKEHENI